MTLDNVAGRKVLHATRAYAANRWDSGRYIRSCVCSHLSSTRQQLQLLGRGEDTVRRNKGKGIHMHRKLPMSSVLHISDFTARTKISWRFRLTSDQRLSVTTIQPTVLRSRFNSARCLKYGLSLQRFASTAPHLLILYLIVLPTQCPRGRPQPSRGLSHPWHDPSDVA